MGPCAGQMTAPVSNHFCHLWRTIHISVLFNQFLLLFYWIDYPNEPDTLISHEMPTPNPPIQSFLHFPLLGFRAFALIIAWQVFLSQHLALFSLNCFWSWEIGISSSPSQSLSSSPPSGHFELESWTPSLQSINQPSFLLYSLSRFCSFVLV